LADSNYPNPFNPTTTIAYSVPETGMTSVKVFNLKGQMINTLVNKEVAAGSQSITWNGKDASGNAVASGLYFVRVENSGKAVTRKMLLSK
jgi:flagellar hook assembly protein FlgD